MTNAKAEPTHLSPSEAAARLSVSPDFLRRACRSGELAFARFGRLVRIPVASLDAYVAARLIGPDPARKPLSAVGLPERRPAPMRPRRVSARKAGPRRDSGPEADACGLSPVVAG